MLTAIGGTAEMSLRILELQDEIADLRKKLEDRDEELKTRQDEVLCLSGRWQCAVLNYVGAYVCVLPHWLWRLTRAHCHSIHHGSKRKRLLFYFM